MDSLVLEIDDLSDADGEETDRPGEQGAKFRVPLKPPVLTMFYSKSNLK